MGRLAVLSVSFVALLHISTACAAGANTSVEPSFCSIEAMKKLENTPRIPGIENHHIFQIGKLTLIGLAVGNSKYTEVEKLAATRGQNLSRSEKSCTWYMNDGNKDARAGFVWRYVDRPSNDIEGTVEQYETVLQSSFDQEAVNMVTCAEDHQYLAMGCDGMRHRGPTVFAMFLAFAGCSPENAVAIANSYWGLNGVPAKSRLAVAQKGYELGEQRPLSRQRLQDVMLSTAAQ